MYHLKMYPWNSKENMEVGNKRLKNLKWKTRNFSLTSGSRHGSLFYLFSAYTEVLQGNS